MTLLKREGVGEFAVIPKVELSILKGGVIPIYGVRENDQLCKSLQKWK